MKTLALFLLAALSAFAQSTVLSPTFTIQNTAIADAYAWSRGIPGTPTAGQLQNFQLTLTNSITAGALTLTVTGSTVGMPASGALVIDAEAIPFSAQSAGVFTVTRTGAQQTTAAAHSAGALVNVLMYATNGQILFGIFNQAMMGISQGLGSNSALIGPALAARNTANATLGAISSGSGQ